RFSEDLFAKYRTRQLHREIRGAVVLVDDWIHFDDLEAEQAAVVSDNLHGQMSFAIRRPAAHRSADTGRVLGIDPVHIERDVIAGSSAPSRAQRLLHHGAHAALVNIAHGVNLGHARAADILPLGSVYVAYT